MSQQSVHSTPNLKEIAADYLRLVASGNAREAFRKYVGQEFRHHNIFFYYLQKITQSTGGMHFPILCCHR